MRSIRIGTFRNIKTRPQDEEAMLEQELKGYVGYERNVRYRLVPGL